MLKINLSYFGHNNPSTLDECTGYLIKIFKKFKFKNYKKEFFQKDKINIMIEGWHPQYRDIILEKLIKSCNMKKGLLITEKIFISKYLSKRFGTFNNRTLDLNKKNDIYKFFYLLYLNFNYFFIKLFKKKLWDIFQRIKNEDKNQNLLFKICYKILFFIFKNLDDANGIYYWKERYNFFYQILKYFDFIILLNLQNYDKLSFNNKQKIFKIPYLSTGKNINIKNIYNEKKIDCLFTGQLTEHRENIIKKLKNNLISVKCLDYLHEKRRRKIYRRSKIYLCLKKFHNDNYPEGARSWYCLENSFFFIVEKANIGKKFLNKFCIEIENPNETSVFSNEIIKILQNYSHYQKIFHRKLKSFRNFPFYKSKEIIKFTHYLNRL